MNHETEDVSVDQFSVAPPKEPQKKLREKEAKEKIIEILQDRQDLKSQKQIAEVFFDVTGKRRGQSYISRLINDMDPKPRRNDEGCWYVPDKSSHAEKLVPLKELLEVREGDAPFFYGDVAFAVLKTPPGYNVLAARKITEIYQSEVLATFCPDDLTVIILYRLRKNKVSNEAEPKDEGITPPDGTGKDETSEQEKIYRPSRMVKDMRRICREIREA